MDFSIFHFSLIFWKLTQPATTCLESSPTFETNGADIKILKNEFSKYFWWIGWTFKKLVILILFFSIFSDKNGEAVRGQPDGSLRGEQTQADLSGTKLSFLNPREFLKLDFFLVILSLG